MGLTFVHLSLTGAGWAWDLPSHRREPGLAEVKLCAQDTAVSMTWALGGLLHSPSLLKTSRPLEVP